MSHDEFAPPPPRGLPAELPPGERLLWQGTPRWGALAWRAYKVRQVLAYFGVLLAARLAFGLFDRQPGLEIAESCLLLMALGAVAMGLLALLAFFSARATVYSITNRRVVWKHGIAVPMTMNVPFACVESAAVRLFGDGTGDIVMKLPASKRVGFLVNWPHLRPGRFAQPQPSFRAVEGASDAAEILGRALSA